MAHARPFTQVCGRKSSNSNPSGSLCPVPYTMACGGQNTSDFHASLLLGGNPSRTTPELTVIMQSVIDMTNNSASTTWNIKISCHDAFLVLIYYNFRSLESTFFLSWLGFTAVNCRKTCAYQSEFMRLESLLHLSSACAVHISHLMWSGSPFQHPCWDCLMFSPRFQ